MDRLRITGAAEHNLRNVDLELPLGRWIAVTGPSGSGKTSLVFSTLVSESQRRYLATLSARARQYLARLGRPRLRAIDGVPVAISVGEQAATPNPRSTVGTLTGLLDLLRLLFARAAVSPGDIALSRSHFSFNHPVGACEACQGLGEMDRVDPQLLVADPSRSIRAGALVPTLKNGYTVYSQVTLEVMNQICEAHGFSVHAPWSDLTDEQRDVILYGTKALKVPFGKHSIESRMRWKGITARPRQEGYYRGLVPVIEETLARSRNPGVLRFVRSTACTTCRGTRLGVAGREAKVGAFTLPQLLSVPTEGLPTTLARLPTGPVWAALRPSVEGRLERMRRLSLGHLTLDRSSTTLSGGESQRVRLAAQLGAGLGGLLVSLDEPTLGLHPEAGPPMARVLEELLESGNTLLVVEHDPDMVRYADHVVAIGPGAGPEGGRVVFEGAPEPDPLGPPPTPKTDPRPGTGSVIVRGASLHNLQDATLQVRLGAFNVVLGPSGAGKSSLVFGTLLPALVGDRGGPYDALEGAATAGVRALDARPLGRTSRSTPATFSGLFDLVRARFAGTARAKELGFGAGRFSYNNKEGRCPDCEGLGVQRIGLHLVADAEIRCPTCEGRRYDAATLEVELRDASIADVLEMSVSEAAMFFSDDPAVAALARAMDDLGLGYLVLGQPSASLSRGEAQRVKLATLLGKQGAASTLLLLDEPDRGLHPDDVARLIRAFDALVDAGHTIVAISHHRHLWAAADHLTEVRDGKTRHVVLDRLPRLSAPRPQRPPVPQAEALQLNGLRIHNINGIDVRIPHDGITAIVGVSGSGKSSLAFHGIVSEAWHRYAESLPFSARRFIRRLPRASLDGAEGLRTAIALRQGQARAPRRSTVATQSEVGPLLRTLWSRAGRLDGQPCSMTAEHFSSDRPLGACPDCDGLGSVSRCDPQQLVTHPERPLMDGALGGTRPGRFFTEPDGQHMATLRAAADGVDLNRPFHELPEVARELVLFGAGDRQLDVVWKFKRGKRSGEHRFQSTWDGLCVLVEREARRRASNKRAEEWSAPLREAPCRACQGRRLRQEVAKVDVGGRTLPDLLAVPVREVVPSLEACSAGLDEIQRVVIGALLPEIRERLDELCGLGLGHLTLERRSQSLSDGELQRVRLAGVLRSGLTGTMIVLDEPGSGLHPHQLERLVDRLRHLQARGNTVIVVTHRPQLIRAADHLVELGPGAGEAGGRIVAEGPPVQVLQGSSPTAQALRTPPGPPETDADPGRIEILGAQAHNLRSVDVELPAAGFVAVTGVSGSGKSSLIFDVLLPSARDGRPVACREIQGLGRFAAVRAGRGRPGNATALGALGLMPALQRWFEPVGKEAGLARQAFSFASPAGRCETCKGTGRHDVPMDVLADLSLPCPACGGRRYRPEVLAVQWQGMNVAEFLDAPIGSLESAVSGPLAVGIDCMARVGLGHLSLGRRCAELSGGEAQRLTLAATLLTRTRPNLVLLDEPATGLHEADLSRLVGVFRDMALRGDLIVAAEHRLSLIRAADWVVDLGPGGGPEGGRVIGCGAVAALKEGLTARHLRA